MDGVKYEFSDRISLYTKNDSDRRRSVSQSAYIISNNIFKLQRKY